MSVAEFYALLETHDWYYSHSDDQRAWRSGQQAHERLCEIARHNAELSALLDAYSRHIFEGRPKPAHPLLPTGV